MLFLKEKLYSRYILVAIFMEVFYMAFAFFFYFTESEYLTSFSLSESRLVLSLWFLIFCVLYGVIMKIKHGALSMRRIIFFYFLFSFTLILVWPFGSSDVFYYLSLAHGFVDGKYNIFLTPPKDLTSDVFQYFIPWQRTLSMPSVYGPLWAYFSFLPVLVFKNSVILSLLFLKMMIVFFNFGIMVLLFKILKFVRPDIMLFGTMLYAWNPFILYESAVNSHNDFMMIFFLLASLYAYVRGKFIFVFPFLTLSFLTKYIIILLFPIYGAFFLFKKKSRIRYIYIASLFISIFMIVIFYLPWWEGFEIFSSFWRLINIQHNNLIFPSLLIFTGLGVFYTKIISLSSYFLMYVFLFFRSVRAPFIKLIHNIFWVIFLYIFIASFWVWAWYFVWLIPLGIILYKGKQGVLILFLTVFALFGYNLNYVIILLIFMLAGVIWFVTQRICIRCNIPLRLPSL